MDQPEQERMIAEYPERLSQNTLRFLIRHISGAGRRQREREEKIAGFESQISMLKDSALSKKPNKKEIEQGFDELGQKMKELISEERVIVLNQEKEERVIEELRERIDMLEEKFHGLSHVQSITSDEHAKRIDEISRKIRAVNPVQQMPASAQSAVKSRGGPAREKTDDSGIISDKERQILKLSGMINEADKSYNELKKKKVNKERLEAIQRTIRIHKRKLRDMKAW